MCIRTVIWAQTVVLALPLYISPAIAQTNSITDLDVDPQVAFDAEFDVATDEDSIAAVFDERRLGRPGEIEFDIDTAVPRPNSLFPQLKPQYWPRLKRRLAECYGLKLAGSYQQLYQNASESLAGTTAWGQWLQLEAQWELIDRGGDYQGSLVGSLDWRDSIGGNVPPGYFGLSTGSLWASDVTCFEWDMYAFNLFWQQWLGQDKFVFRVGQHFSAAVLDFFRFGDFRSSFTNSQLVFPAAINPVGPPGFGAHFKWWPIDDSEFYVVGTVSDINAPFPARGIWDWGGLFRTGEAFVGLEFGKNWRRGAGDFDHAHLTLWYADEVSTAPFPTDDGWGFKVHVEKQLERLVFFGNYGYNTSYGGGFGYTNSRQAASVGLGLMKPFCVAGEMAFAFTLGEPLDRPDPRRGIVSNRDQFGVEAYWKLLVTPDLWFTPGIQMVIDPTYNPAEDFIAIPQLKFQAFF